jgi:hypothetical protein
VIKVTAPRPVVLDILVTGPIGRRHVLQFYLDNFCHCGQGTAQRREMIRIASLIGAAVLALGSACPARAQTLYRCVPDGQAVAPDQRASFEIGITPNGEFASIIFRAANGAAYDRGEQFDEQNRQDGNGQHYWTGTSRTKPNVTMVGSLSRKGDRLVYSETIGDTILGSVQITSTCKSIVQWLSSALM